MNAQSLNYDNYDGIAGVDEVGRGAIAGPIVAAAVILPRHQEPIFKDSKKISSNKRRQFYRVLKASGADIGIAIASQREIEKLNVHFASLIAMKRAIERLIAYPYKSWSMVYFCQTSMVRLERLLKAMKEFNR